MAGIITCLSSERQVYVISPEDGGTPPDTHEAGVLQFICRLHAGLGLEPAVLCRDLLAPVYHEMRCE